MQMLPPRYEDPFGAEEALAEAWPTCTRTLNIEFAIHHVTVMSLFS